MSNSHRIQPPAPTPLEQGRAAWAEEEAARARRRVKSLGSLRNGAELVIIFGWIISVCGVVVGAIAVLSTDDDGSGFGPGVAVVLGSILFGALVNLFGRWSLAWAEMAER